jgi:hypothetical protein
MHVHIVNPWAFQTGPNSEHIIPRLNRALAEGNGWTLGPEADPAADLNYLGCYLFWKEEMAGLSTAAWCTHYDYNYTPNRKAWEGIIPQLSLRIATAYQTLEKLERHGPAAKVRLGIDREHFTPVGKRQGAGQVIGTSGLVYRGGRKGETLFQQIAQDALFEKHSFVAAGAGWGVAESRLPYEEMPDFYRGLDVYVCTSLIEGGPAGPLEALACGVQVVIPCGVGMLDELPDIPGIWRYGKGDFWSLEGAVQTALLSQADPEALREATAGYSLEAWCEGHRMAVAGVEA